MLDTHKLLKEAPTVSNQTEANKSLVGSQLYTDSFQSMQPETASIPLKILYTLHGIDTQKYVVKPPNPVNVRVFRALGLGTVEMKSCLHAIRDASPDFASICETHDDEYAVYSVDYAEDCLPLQSHGRVSQTTMIEATGKLVSSKLMREQLELLIHLIPVRKPHELIAEYQPFSCVPNSMDSANNSNLTISHTGLQSELNDPVSDIPIPKLKPPLLEFPFPTASIMNSHLLHSMPALPPPTQIPASLTNASKVKSEPVLPSSPPFRARPSKILSNNGHNNDKSQVSSGKNLGSAQVKRSNSETATSKRRKASSPKAEGESQCGNCGVAAASTWRRVESSDGKKELLCNACGLYYKAKHVMRPSSLWEKVRTKGEYDNTNMNTVPASKTNTVRASMSNYSMPDSNSIHSQNSNVLWSQDAASHLMSSSNVDIADRLLDKSIEVDQKHDQRTFAPKFRKSDNTSDLMEFQKDPNIVSHIINGPSTPTRKSHYTMDHQAPDSIQKLFGISTPEQKNQLLMPGSGSASKWLRQVMNPASFEDFLKSPTPRKNKSSTTDLQILTSSPPTSSNLFSEISDWNNIYSAHSPGNPSGIDVFAKHDEKGLNTTERVGVEQ